MCNVSDVNDGLYSSRIDLADIPDDIGLPDDDLYLADVVNIQSSSVYSGNISS